MPILARGSGHPSLCRRHRVVPWEGSRRTLKYDPAASLLSYKKASRDSIASHDVDRVHEVPQDAAGGGGGGPGCISLESMAVSVSYRDRRSISCVHVVIYLSLKAHGFKGTTATGTAGDGGRRVCTVRSTARLPYSESIRTAKDADYGYY